NDHSTCERPSRGHSSRISRKNRVFSARGEYTGGHSHRIGKDDHRPIGRERETIDSPHESYHARSNTSTRPPALRIFRTTPTREDSIYGSYGRGPSRNKSRSL